MSVDLAGLYVIIGIVIPVELARARFRQLKTVVADTRRKLGEGEVWNWKEKGIKFSAVKFAEPEEAKIGDFTGIRVRMRGRLNATREAASDLAKAFGKPTREKVSKILKKPKILVWKDPRLS